MTSRRRRDPGMQTVAHNLAEGAFLVIIVLLFLLGNFRAAVIVALAIPLSMLAAVTVMYFTGLRGQRVNTGMTGDSWAYASSSSSTFAR